MQIEYQREDLEDSINYNKYNFQQILEKDHICDEFCQDYKQLQRFSVRLYRIPLEIVTLEFQEAWDFCQSKIEVYFMKFQKKNNREIKRQKRQQKIVVKNIPFNFKIKSILHRIHENHISLVSQSVILGLSIERLKYLHKEIEINQNFHYIHPFEFVNDHSIWVSKYVRQENISNLFSIQNIYKDFLIQFNVTREELSISQFRKYSKQIGYSYKKTSKVSMQATTQINKEQRVQYALQFLFLIQNNLYPIYIDESGFRNDYPQKVWSQVGQKLHSNFITITKRINIIGAIGQGLFLFQCI
ncbi:unnamed protein product [Paramecium pentaurelia]|uniref:Tc1-like transposase DDE domain-containing protein n=1 Tax=Paramecium pentaurelia TaxID=43138 RepID=A0A8S1XLC4_9CILI|nr:unnamed protein product [Paramecium pentaurelia]